jgi:hypothetical protein
MTRNERRSNSDGMKSRFLSNSRAEEMFHKDGKSSVNLAGGGWWWWRGELDWLEGDTEVLLSAAIDDATRESRGVAVLGRGFQSGLVPLLV